MKRVFLPTRLAIFNAVPPMGETAAYFNNMTEDQKARFENWRNDPDIRRKYLLDKEEETELRLDKYHELYEAEFSLSPLYLASVRLS